MVVQPVSILFLIALILNTSITAGMMVLALTLHPNSPVNRRFALVLASILLGNSLTIFVWPYTAFGLEFPAQTRLIVVHMLGLTVALGSVLTYFFADTLLKTRQITPRVRNILVGSLCLLVLIAIVYSVETLNVPVPPDILDPAANTIDVFFIGVGIFVLIGNANTIYLLWKNRYQRPDRLSLAGTLLFIATFVMLSVPLFRTTGLPPVMATIGAILIAIALVRQQIVKPLVVERSQLTSERDTLLQVNQIVVQMLDAPTLESRVQTMAAALRKFGWVSAYLVLQEKQAIIGNPTPTSEEVKHHLLELLEAWHWLDESLLAPYKNEVGYFFPAQFEAKTLKQHTLPEAYASALYAAKPFIVIPLYVNVSQFIGFIYLVPSSPALSEYETRTVSILTTHARSIVENQQLLDESQMLADALQQQIEELVMMQRVDQELSATLNFDNVMMLTMDWALRRTGATAGMLNMLTSDGQGMYPVAALGYPMNTSEYNPNNPLPITSGIVGRAVRTQKVQIVPNTARDSDYMPLIQSTQSEVAVPMEMRGRVIGVLNLESDQEDAFNNSHVSFIIRLAQRAVVAMDNARLYREAEGRADEMAALYSAGRSISSSIERADVLRNSAQALAAVLNVSSTLLLDFIPDKHELVVNTRYRLGTFRHATDQLLPVGHRFNLAEMPGITEALNHQHLFVAQFSDAHLLDDWHNLLSFLNAKSLIFLPLVLQNKTIGAAIAIETSRERIFNSDDLLMAESVISQAVSALRQAELYEDVRELEKIKSEMIRMASHDLRNPLGNAMAYFDLLMNKIGGQLNDVQKEYAASVRMSTSSMLSLIEDLLTLEHAENERQSSWKLIDFTAMVETAATAQKPNADLKQHQFQVKIDREYDYFVFGSTTQLRQAVANLISNAIKYTPDSGSVNVRLWRDDGLLKFEVQDNGYGISKERQGKLFQRFYRARERATDGIPGTGLGLSLVKTVIERHGGQVWVESELGKGSTFGFSLPLTTPEAHSEPVQSPAQGASGN